MNENTVQTIRLTRAGASELLCEVINQWPGFNEDIKGPFPIVEFTSEVLRKLGFK